MTATDPFADVGADYWRAELAAIERLLAAKVAAADAIAPVLRHTIAVAERAGSICGNPPPERGAELVAAYGRMIVRHAAASRSALSR